MLNELLEQRKLPPLQSRGEMMEILQREEYGYLPQTDFSMTVSEPEPFRDHLVFPQTSLSRVKLRITNAHGTHALPVTCLLQQDGKKHPVVVFLDFTAQVPSFYYPVELLAEKGVNVFSFCCQDAASDDGDFSNGVGPLLLPGGQSAPTDCGKLGLWAWCAMRVLDYALTLPCADAAAAAVAGHSRLGKTALLAAMMDERFRFAFSSNAGCAGDSLAHGSLGLTSRNRRPGESGRGETIGDITANFPYWFCRNYLKYAADGFAPDFDQHFLLASIAPRFVYVSSSSLDDWADQRSQQLCCAAAGKRWEELGLPGFIHGDRFLAPGESLQEGRIGYHMRAGLHFLSMHDWSLFLQFMEKHRDDRP